MARAVARARGSSPLADFFCFFYLGYFLSPKRVRRIENRIRCNSGRRGYARLRYRTAPYLAVYHRKLGPRTFKFSDKPLAYIVTFKRYRLERIKSLGIRHLHIRQLAHK